VNFTRRFARNLDRYQAREIGLAELTAGVQGWVNHVRYADTWGLREHVFATHPIRPPAR
jgi:RNA-directed DNA polymerase